jgi:hypothetical protein
MGSVKPKVQKRYEIVRGSDGVRVTVFPETGSRYFLDERTDLRLHSQSGFEYGYFGSGPSQLALAMLADHFSGDENGDSVSIRLYQDFKAMVISAVDPELMSWEITSEQIESTVRSLLR